MVQQGTKQDDAFLPLSSIVYLNLDYEKQEEGWIDID